MEDDDGTLLASLNSRFGRVLGPGECQTSLSQVGPSRAKLLDLRAPDPVLVLTQYVKHARVHYLWRLVGLLRNRVRASKMTSCLTSPPPHRFAKSCS
ncbi:hypothetical protein NicSoilB8_10460 [Arthrobacter sp. NicSoilB8]|nr:hypothetical protein NicSoilB8_10460 [Arthrobacter sp. NicSoilB8]